MTAQTHLTINEVGGKIMCYHCGHTILEICYRCYSKVDGGIKADMESASHIVLQKSKGILHLKTCWGMHRCQWPA